MPLKISVVTPSFNQGGFIRQTLDSIHSQGYPNLEHVIIDGGSADESVDIIEEYEPRLSYWVSEPDGGQTDALIKGFARTTGDIQCWLNSDDLFEPWTLHEVGRFFEQHPEVDFVYGDSTWIDDKGAYIKPKREHRFSRFIWLYDHNFIPQPSTFWRKSLYDAVGGLHNDFDFAMDADLWIRFAEVTSPRHVRRPWSRMRFYADQKNTRFRSVSLQEIEAIRDRYVDSETSLVRGLKRRTARTYRVGLKLATGAYSLRELGMHAKGLTGRDWEKERLEGANADQDSANS